MICAGGAARRLLANLRPPIRLRIPLAAPAAFVAAIPFLDKAPRRSFMVACGAACAAAACAIAVATLALGRGGAAMGSVVQPPALVGVVYGAHAIVKVRERGGWGLGVWPLGRLEERC